MPTNAAAYKKGVRSNAAKKSPASLTLKPGKVTKQLGKAHGGAGRDERSAANCADKTARIAGHGPAKVHSYK